LIKSYKDSNKHSPNIDKKINMIKKELKKKLKNKDIQKKYLEACVKSHCNPGCKGTIFQNGEFPINEFKKQFSSLSKKNSDKSINLVKKMRNDIFKGKKTVLNDDFYIGIKKSKNKLKKNGALSGCALMTL
jgi:hypothetical protein